MTDQNMQLEEATGATPEEHLESIARLRLNSQRYEAMREMWMLEIDDPDMANEIQCEMFKVEPPPSTRDKFDRHIDLLAKLVPPCR